MMVRNLTNSFTKDPMCLVPLQTENVLKMWYKAVGECGLSITSGLPVLSEYYELFNRSGVEYTDGFLQHVQKNTSHLERMWGVAYEKRPVTAATRCSFYYAFGILPAYQIELEKLFKKMSLLTTIDTLLHRDLTLDKYDNCPVPLIEHMF